jgi:hypothetical protein
MTVRYERKYLVPNELLFSLRHRVRAFIRPDSFALRGDDRIPEYTEKHLFRLPYLKLLFRKDRRVEGSPEIKDQGL